MTNGDPVTRREIERQDDVNRVAHADIIARLTKLEVEFEKFRIEIRTRLRDVAVVVTLSVTLLSELIRHWWKP